MTAVLKMATPSRIKVIRFAVSIAAVAKKNIVATIATRAASRLESTQRAASSGRRANAPTTTWGVRIPATKMTASRRLQSPQKSTSRRLPAKAWALIRNRSGFSLVRVSWPPTALILTLPAYPLRCSVSPARLVRSPAVSVERSVLIRTTSQPEERIVQSGAWKTSPKPTQGEGNEHTYETRHPPGSHFAGVCGNVGSAQCDPWGCDTISWILEHGLGPRDRDVTREPSP